MIDCGLADGLVNAGYSVTVDDRDDRWLQQLLPDFRSR